MPEDSTAKDDNSDHSPSSSTPFHQDSAFYGMTLTQFLGAFNDNLFKQLMLLLFVSVPVASGAASVDMQPYALATFALPFILFSGVAGFLSDRYSKRFIIVLSKVAEILVMGLGVGAFAIFASSAGSATSFGMITLLATLFLMGTQSTFFGPSKYGILPEMLRKKDLSQVNGVIIMTTFLAIIFGTALAGVLKDMFDNKLWFAAQACVVIAVLGTATSLLVRRVSAARPGLAFQASAVFISRDTWGMLRGDRPLLAALLASSLFWFVGAIVQPACNSFGKLQLGVSDTRTSIMVACIGVGIAIGCFGAGMISGGKIRFGLLRIGAWGIVVCLLILAASGIGGTQWLNYDGCAAMMIVLGIFTGMYSVPLQVYLQARPPAGLKGRMIATQNLINWIAIFLSAPLYGIADGLLKSYNLPRSGMFAIAACCMLPVAIFYRPKDESLV